MKLVSAQRSVLRPVVPLVVELNIREFQVVTVDLSKQRIENYL